MQFSSTNDILCEKIQITKLKSWIIKYKFYHEFSSAIELEPYALNWSFMVMLVITIALRFFTSPV